MQILPSSTANTVIVEATMGEDGALHVDEGMGLLLSPGARVMLTISPIVEPPQRNGAASLVGTVTSYDDPFGPATDASDWEAMRDC